jgi:hypothetical protein
VWDSVVYREAEKARRRFIFLPSCGSKVKNKSKDAILFILICVIHLSSGSKQMKRQSQPGWYPRRNLPIYTSHSSGEKVGVNRKGERGGKGIWKENQTRLLLNSGEDS